jgi:CheY-like chemotaxis protein
MARVLILEDEEILRASMARSLRKLPGILVEEAGTVAAAVSCLDRAPPDLIFSDLDLPDGSGIELLGELVRRGRSVPVIFISAFLRDFVPQIPIRSGIELRSKPVTPEELRAIVSQRLQGEGPPAAARFSAVDYLQLAATGRRSVEIVVAEGEEAVGRVVVVSGEVWHAEDQAGAGFDAFRRLTSRADATAECRACRETPPRTLDGSLELLLLRVAWLNDEGRG